LEDGSPKMEVGIQMMEEQIINFIKIIFKIAKKYRPIS